MTTGAQGRDIPAGSTDGSAARARALTVTAWVLQGLLGLAMIGAGAAKVTGDPAMVQLFVDIGGGQGLRFVVGGLEIAGGIGLLVPRLRAWATLGLLLLLLGATVTNVLILHTNTLLSVVYALAALAILLLRRGELPLTRRWARSEPWGARRG